MGLLGPAVFSKRRAINLPQAPPPAPMGADDYDPSQGKWGRSPIDQLGTPAQRMGPMVPQMPAPSQPPAPSVDPADEYNPAAGKWGRSPIDQIGTPAQRMGRAQPSAPAAQPPADPDAYDPSQGKWGRNPIDQIGTQAQRMQGAMQAPPASPNLGFAPKQMQGPQPQGPPAQAPAVPQYIPPQEQSWGLGAGLDAILQRNRNNALGGR